jgi:hypothetical protein
MGESIAAAENEIESYIRSSLVLSRTSSEMLSATLGPGVD